MIRLGGSSQKAVALHDVPGDGTRATRAGLISLSEPRVGPQSRGRDSRDAAGLDHQRIDGLHVFLGRVARTAPPPRRPPWPPPADRQNCGDAQAAALEGTVRELSSYPMTRPSRPRRTPFPMPTA